MILYNKVNNKEVRIGKLGSFFFLKGYYAYLGSSFLKNGIIQRLRWHFKPLKKERWHIDFLTKENRFEIIGFLTKCSNIKGKEVDISNCIGSKFSYYIKGFGSSDTKSFSHLFYLGDYLYKNSIDTLEKCLEKS